MIKSFLKIYISKVALLLICISSQSQSVDIPLGNWRAHLSFNRVQHIAIGNEYIYAASDMGLLVFDVRDHSMSTMSKVTGLSSTGISAIALDEINNQLLIGYEDGNLDFIKDNTVYNFSRLKDLNTTVGSRQINHISVSNERAYLSTDFGVVVFDLGQRELIETWRDLGRGGTSLKIKSINLFSDSIVAATEKGIISGKLTDNLLDFSKWHRRDAGDFASEVSALTIFNNSIFAAINSKGLYKISGSANELQPYLQGNSFQSLNGKDNLLIVSDGQLWMLSSNDQLIQVADDAISYALSAKESNDGTLWIADRNNGLVSNIAEGFQHFLPNGPSITRAFRLKYLNNRMYAIAGGFSPSGVPMEKSGVINFFENGFWNTLQTELNDVTDVEASANKTYFSSFGDGLSEKSSNGTTLFDHTNSPLVNAGASEKSVLISDIEPSASGLWVANYGATNSLHLLKEDQTWQSFTTTFSQGQYPIVIATDLFDNVWMGAHAQTGGLVVFNPQTGTSILKNDQPGSGGLLNKYVRSLALDREGNMWVGTEEGLGYFYSEQEDAVLPIFENRYLLKDETISAIEVDGGNRKWIGTERGAWLFDPAGESLVYKFTKDNSPLLSDNIIDIEINDQTGEVFFSTDKGLISFRSDATISTDDFSEIKIFPNPVTSAFSGTVGISGLATDAFVKITDVSGKLIWQSQAQGGTATWDVRDYKGKKARTGMYLVFAASSDGRESVVGKIAVIE